LFSKFLRISAYFFEEVTSDPTVYSDQEGEIKVILLLSHLLFSDGCQEGFQLGYCQMV